MLTDSGGIQEETTALGVPCLTLRETTERPITVTEGTNQLVGTDPDAIVAAAHAVLRGEVEKRCPALWDGHAAPRIARVLIEGGTAKRPAPAHGSARGLRAELLRAVVRVLFDIVHPAHVHFFKYLHADLVAEGHETLVIAREKDVTLALLDEYQIPYTTVGRSGRTDRVGQARELIERDLTLYRAARRFRPDFVLTRNPAGVQVARLLPGADGRVRHRRRPRRGHPLPRRGAVRQRHHHARLHDRELRRQASPVRELQGAGVSASVALHARPEDPLDVSASATIRTRSCASSRCRRRTIATSRA